MTARPSQILEFWFAETPSKRWYVADPGFDAEIRRRFESTWSEARDGALDGWAAGSDGALALILLLDQFSRNMFRGEGQAFSTDAKARFVASLAVEQGYDRAAPSGRRQFFYMPFMHSELLADQDRCIALFRENLPDDKSSLSFALKHRDVIARFGRFPARNKALGRATTAEEAEFLASHPGGF